MPLTSPQAVLADVLLDGALEAQLKLWRDAGDSWEIVARRLWVATGEKVSVTGMTVQHWANGLGIT